MCIDFFDALDLRELDLVSALRKLLSRLELDESTPLDSIMSVFADKFVEANPADIVSASRDSAYLVAYAVLVLSIDLTKASQKKKISLEQFQGMLRGTRDGGDFPADFVANIYNTVQENGLVKPHPSLGAPVDVPESTSSCSMPAYCLIS